MQKLMAMLDQKRTIAQMRSPHTKSDPSSTFDAAVASQHPSD